MRTDFLPWTWRRLRLLPVLGVFAALPASAQLVINEIDYDQPSTDTAEFIEIKNTGATSVNLGGWNSAWSTARAAAPWSTTQSHCQRLISRLGATSWSAATAPT